MQRLPSAFIRTSLGFLLAGFILGAWMMIALPFDLPVYQGTRVIHIHFLTVGFMTMMVIGVSLWMFPAPPGVNGRAEIARLDPWGWMAYWLLTVGLILRSVVAFSTPGFEYGVGRYISLVSALGQVAGIGCFARAIWKRTRPKEYPHLTK